MMPNEIRRQDMLLAQEVARRIASTLQQRGLPPAFQGHYLTRYAGITLLISELQTTRLGRLENYTDEELLHQISTNLKGRKVYLSNTTGLRYVVPLSKPRGLPKRVDYPADSPRGRCALGINYMGQPIAVDWADLGHLLVAGMTGSGKSMFLRLLAYQAIQDGMSLLIADIDQATFPMLKNHAALAAPLAEDPAGAFALIQQALTECDRRAALYKAMPGYPETLEEYNSLAVKQGKETLPRVLLILDEFSATLSSLGGGKGDAARLLAAIGFRGRKFGVSVVFAAHEFTKEHIGLLRDQARTVVMFRVQSREMARRLGCEGAESIGPARPGLAMTNRWGPMQTYFIPKDFLISDALPASEMDDQTAAILGMADQYGGRVTLANIIRWSGAGQRQARELQERMALRGWIQKDAQQANAYCITPKTREILTNRLTRQTPTNPTNREKNGGNSAQTAVQTL
ncbi:MAG: FtsK/SpoIIIE domain-containing protein [Anaerolineales bacterium]|nr:FtsK/SpoIIIE domain-containing protein [Anaerolineales bacterium]